MFFDVAAGWKSETDDMIGIGIFDWPVTLRLFRVSLPRVELPR